MVFDISMVLRRVRPEAPNEADFSRCRRYQTKPNQVRSLVDVASQGTQILDLFLPNEPNFSEICDDC
jgi:hypothetical protein